MPLIRPYWSLLYIHTVSSGSKFFRVGEKLKQVHATRLEDHLSKALSPVHPLWSRFPTLDKAQTLILRWFHLCSACRCLLHRNWQRTIQCSQTLCGLFVMSATVERGVDSRRGIAHYTEEQRPLGIHRLTSFYIVCVFCRSYINYYKWKHSSSRINWTCFFSSRPT